MPRYEPLSEEALATIDAGVERLAAEVGVQFDHPRALDLFRAAGQSVDDSTGVGTLPASDPVGGTHTWWVADVEAKALGLLPNSTTIDEYVGFADTSHFTFDYDRSNGITAGQYDFYGTVAHEITEVMGRELGVGQTLIYSTVTYYPLDLFHYSASATRDFLRGGYFSFDNILLHDVLRGDPLIE